MFRMHFFCLVVSYFVLVFVPSFALGSRLQAEFLVQQKKAVLVDIQTLTSNWVYDAASNFLTSRSCLEVSLELTGYPVLLLSALDQVTIDGKEVRIFHPAKTDDLLDVPANVFVLDRQIGVGRHRICVNSELSPNLNRTTFMNIHYGEGKFTEGFLPANMRFDSFEGRIEIKVLSSKPYSAFTNGNLTRSMDNSFVVQLPPNSTSSALFLDLIPSQKVVERSFPVPLKNGRNLQVQLYSEKGDLGESYLLSFEQKIKRAFPILESRLGDFPYDRYVFKSISREVEGAFAGAAALQEKYNSIDLVVHEIGHSYFLANVRPLRGVDLWLHEGLGNWASKFTTGTEELIPNVEKIDLTASWLFQQEFYDAHGTGSNVLKALDFKLKNQGGIFPFLQKIFIQYQGQALSTEDFFRELELLSGQSFVEFKKHYFKGLP